MAAGAAVLAVVAVVAAASGEVGASAAEEVIEAVVAAASAAAISPIALPACRARHHRRRLVDLAAVAHPWAICRHLARALVAAATCQIRVSPIARICRRIGPTQGSRGPAVVALPVFPIGQTSAIVPAVGHPWATSIASSICLTVAVLPALARGQQRVRALAVQWPAVLLQGARRPNSSKTIPRRFQQRDRGLAILPTIVPQRVRLRVSIGLARAKDCVLAAATVLENQAAAVKVCVQAI